MVTRMKKTPPRIVSIRDGRGNLKIHEYLPDAIAARNEVRAIMDTMLNERRAADAEQARIQAEREELALLRAAVAALPPELSAAPAPPANGAKANNRRRKKAALTPLEALIAAVRAGNSRFEDAIHSAYKLGYDDGVLAATTTQ